VARPKGSKNKKTLIKLGILPKADVKLKMAPAVPVVDTRTDEQIVDTIAERFTMYHEMVKGAADVDVGITALIASGSAGVGKTYTATWTLDNLKEKDSLVRWKPINGAASAIGLYMTAYDFRHRGNVIVLDDADRVFDDEESLNILKVLLDTSVERTVSWCTDHSIFKGDSGIPREFVYNGSMIFLTNKDFQDYLDRGTGKYVEHMSALMSRSIYLDLKMHTRREVALWSRHIILRNKVLQGAPFYMSKEQELEAVDWVRDRRDDLREMSIRTILKVGKLMKRFPQEWERACELVLLRNV
jgi:hypothetical protein